MKQKNQFMIPEPIFQAWRFIHKTMKSAQFHEALKVDIMGYVRANEGALLRYIHAKKQSGNRLLITFWRNTKFFMFCQLISDIKLSRCNDTVKDFYQYAVVDLGFLRREFQSRRGPQPTTWPIFPENCTKMKKFWLWGEGAYLTPLHPPLIWAAVDLLFNNMLRCTFVKIVFKFLFCAV